MSTYDEPLEHLHAYSIPEPHLPPLIRFPRPTKWKWWGPVEYSTVTMGAFVFESSRPLFGYVQKAITA